MKYSLAFYFRLSVLLMLAPSGLIAQNRLWVFFKDKPNAGAYARLSNEESSEQYLVNSGVLTKRAIERRLKVLPRSALVTSSDFPVYYPYLDSLKSIGLTITGTSRWFNAAVVVDDSLRLKAIHRFPFVAETEKVVVYTFPIKPLIPVESACRIPMKVSSQPGDSSFYGPSYAQFELSGIPQVHSLGIIGSGVLIGMLDTGFRYENNDAFKNINIVGEHDFIQNDSITKNQTGDTPTRTAMARQHYRC